MSIGSWSPEGETAKQNLQIEPAMLQRFIRCSAAGELDQLDSVLDQQTVDIQSALMRLGREPWMKAAESLEADDILHLIRFFTVAENSLPGWEAGAESPVIWLAKSLRARGEKLDKDLLLWIREHSDNRYLPYGSVL